MQLEHFRLVNSKLFHDVEFVVAHSVICSHKCILNVRAPQMLSSEAPFVKHSSLRGNVARIEFNDTFISSASVCEKLLYFLYTGSVQGFVSGTKI